MEWLLGAKIIISKTIKIKMNLSEPHWDFDIPFRIAREYDFFPSIYVIRVLVSFSVLGFRSGHWVT